MSHLDEILRIGKDLIPDEYERVEYIQNSGTQYINTGITCKDTLSLSCKFQFTSSPDRNRIFGGRTGTTTYGNIEMITYDGKYYVMFGKHPECIIDGLTPDTSIHTIDFKNGEQKLDNSIIATEGYTFSNSTPIYLFGIYNSSSAVIGTLRMFSFIIRDGNNLVRNFIPVKKLSNNEYGMYDTVTQRFFGNAGTGSFTGGSAYSNEFKTIGNIWERAKQTLSPKAASIDIWNTRRVHQTGDSYPSVFTPTKVLPSLKAFGGTVQEIPPKLWGRYKPVEYIESTGTQYIDTGYIMTNDNFKYEITIKDFATKSTANFLLGYCATTTASVAGDIRAFFIYNDYRVAIRYGSQANNSTQKITPSSVNKISFDGTSVFVNDTEFVSVSSKYTSPVYQKLYLLWANPCDMHSDDMGKMACKVYSCQFKQDDILVRNFIPVKDTVDNVYGMFDTVEEKFYGNAGTGAFTAGPEIKRVEYIESTQTTLTNQEPVIKTNIIPNQDTICYIDYQQNQSYNKPSGGVWIFGARTSSSAGEYGFLIGSDSYYASPYNNSSGTNTFRINSASVSNDANRHRFLFKVRENGGTSRRFDNQTVDSVTGQAYVTYSEFEADHGLWIFGCLDGGTDRNRVAMKLYSFKVWQGLDEKLVADMIPILLGTEYAMLDLVEWKIYRNDGTGSFAGGSEVPDRMFNPYALKGNLGNIKYGYDDGAAIPSEYERVEYINNGSNGYIITDIYPSGTDKIYVRASTTEKLSANQALFGNYHDGANAKDFVGYFGNTHFYIWRSGVQQNFVAKPEKDTVYEFTADYLNGSATVKGDNVNETITFTPGTFTCNNKLPLGCRYNNSYGGPYAYNFYAVKYYRNNELIGDFIPVKKVSNNKYGMYDTVSKQFYGNAGTGSFTGGSVINRKIITDGSHTLKFDIPREYERVEYIESSGTQYIDIGFAFDNKTKAEVVWESTRVPPITPAGFIGSRGSSANNLHIAINHGSNGDVASDFNNSNYATYRATYTITLEKKYRVITSAALRAIYDADTNELKASNTALNIETFTCDKNAYLFKANGAGFCLGKMYSVKIWNNDTLQRNFIPVKKVSNNEYGMYDTVTKQFYGNDGTGSFTGGPVIENSPLNIADLLLSAASYIDTQTGTLYKDWTIKILDGTETWDYDANYGRSRLYINDWQKPSAVRAQLFYGNYGTCCHNGESVSSMISGDMYTAKESNATAFYFTYKNSTLEEFKAWLKAKYDEGTPVIVIYPLATPTTEQKTASPVILATKGNKTISAQAEIPVTVQAEYLGKD